MATSKTPVPVSLLHLGSLILGAFALVLVWSLHSFVLGLAAGLAVLTGLMPVARRRTMRNIAVAVEGLRAQGRLEEARAIVDASRRMCPDAAKEMDRLAAMLAAQERTLLEVHEAAPDEPATTPGSEGVPVSAEETEPVIPEPPRSAIHEESETIIPGNPESFISRQSRWTVPEQPEPVTPEHPESVAPDYEKSEPVASERPVASTLGVWIWVLAVPSFLPLVGILPAAALGVCSLILLLRHPRRPWDRRIGSHGLAISMVSFGCLAVWIVRLALGRPFELPRLEDVDVSPDEAWPLIAAKLAVLLLSVVLHECAHGLAAWWSGDGTAARAGRISLNPLVHIDLFGSIVLPLILALVPGSPVFGWAKPVPIDPRSFRRRRRGLLAVTLAGVSANLFLALAFASALLVLGSILALVHPEAVTKGFFVPFAVIRVDGMNDPAGWISAAEVLKAGMVVNMSLLFLNILPIPPLDGFGVLESLAPRFLSRPIAALKSASWIIFLALIAVGAIDVLIIYPTVYGLLILAAVLSCMTGLA